MPVQSQVSRTQKATFSQFMASPVVVNRVNSIVGGKNGQRFITAIVSAVAANPALSKCDQSSILSAALLGESLNLSPSPQLGQYYIVPFTVKGQKQAQFQMGYKGYIQLAIRSGYYKKLNVLAIKEGELINYDPLNEEINVSLIHDETVREQTPTTGYYAMFEYINGFRKTMYWSKAKMESHAETYSKSYQKKSGSSFWEKNFDAMAYKTMLRQLISKWGIMSIEMQNAFESDMAVVDENGNKDYVDNPSSHDAIDVTPQIEEPVQQQEEIDPMMM